MSCLIGLIHQAKFGEHTITWEIVLLGTIQWVVIESQVWMSKNEMLSNWDRMAGLNFKIAILEFQMISNFTSCESLQVCGQTNLFLFRTKCKSSHKECTKMSVFSRFEIQNIPRP